MEGDEQMSGGENYRRIAAESGENLDSAPDSRPHREKFNSLLILLIGLFAVVIGGVSMWLNLANPFADIIRKGQEQAAALAVKQQAELAILQSKDTDKDGLSDYDETNKYDSSPYLKDSDGDGVDDKAEVDRGTDPNCPEGQNCFSSGDQSASSDSVPSMQTAVGNPTVTITADYIRQIMKQNGATDEQLSLLTDDELMAEYKSYLEANPQVAASLAAQGVNVNFGASAAGDTALAQPDAGNLDLEALNINSVDDLHNLTGAQIRQLMINSGASAELLAQVDDAELKTMFLSQLDSQTPTQ
ncbi:MAG: hypothetical protein WC517_04950 [Patescibacteria group bacterium]